MNKNLKYAKGLLGFSAIVTLVAFLIADVFNSSHLFNPDWPPHARFHSGMQFTALTLMSLVSIKALFGKMTWAKAKTAALAPITFWPGLLVAWLIPGTSAYATPELEKVGIPINLILMVIFLAITVAGLWFAYRDERMIEN